MARRFPGKSVDKTLCEDPLTACSEMTESDVDSDVLISGPVILDGFKKFLDSEKYNKNAAWKIKSSNRSSRGQ
jgi:hypothetical protein